MSRQRYGGKDALAEYGSSYAAQDEIKFIIADREDYLWAKSIIESYKLPDRCTVLLSPAFNSLDPKALAGWILADNLSVRLQLQIHKYIWGTEVRGV